MSRPGREKQREQQYQGVGAVIDVRVPGTGQGAGGTGSASIGGVPVVPAPGEELQQTVLNHLHRIALATGRPVLATVHDERIGFVVPLRVHPDGSSCFTAEPVRTSAAQEAVPAPPRPPQEPAQAAQDKATQLLRTPPEPGAQATPTFRLRAVQEPQPLGEFGPPPVMGGARPHSESLTTPERKPEPEPGPDLKLHLEPEPAPMRHPKSEPAPMRHPKSEPAPMRHPKSEPAPMRHPKPEPAPKQGPEPHLAPELHLDPDPKPTPPRGFDAVAEAILGPSDVPSPTSTFLAEPTARIGEAVKAGRIDTAAALAEQTLAEASAALAPDHPELLRLLELAAYVAYLAAEPVRAFRLSLDVAGVHRRTHDAEAAYDNVQSAATAWRAVRDPALGLDLGRELIGLWTELAAEAGPAADDVEELESARARMGRLAERASRASGA